MTFQIAANTIEIHRLINSIYLQIDFRSMDLIACTNKLHKKIDVLIHQKITFLIHPFIVYQREFNPF